MRTGGNYWQFFKKEKKRTHRKKQRNLEKNANSLFVILRCLGDEIFSSEKMD
jgi:hypothetical protein